MVDVNVSDLVRQHYGGDDLAGRVLRSLAVAGVDVSALDVAGLAAADQLHGGFLPATEHLLEQLDLSPATRLLDVGCGIGGPARVAAARWSCPVVGVDLSPDFVAAARTLTQRTGLGHLVEYRVTDAVRLGLDDASFDRAMLVHVGMNVPDKAALFADVRRVLRPGGLFAVYEQMRVGGGEPTYPLPWADDARSSFLATPAEYAGALTAAGFRVESSEDRTAATTGPPSGGRRPIGPAAVFGPVFAERMGNNLAAARAGILAPVLLLARAV